MTIEWRYLKMLKRAGRGHLEGGAAGTKEGELAVLCPACPQPDINMPSSWDSISNDARCVFSSPLSNPRLTESLGVSDGSTHSSLHLTRIFD